MPSNLLIEQGATFSRLLTIKDDLGALIDLTGYQFSGMVRKGCGDTAAVASFSFSIADQVTNKGEVTFSLTPTQTSAIPTPGNSAPNRKNSLYTFDIEMTRVDLVVIRLLQGTVEVSPEATK